MTERHDVLRLLVFTIETVIYEIQIERCVVNVEQPSVYMDDF